MIVLGDQLDLASVLPADFDAQQDLLWMAESRAEASRVWSHKARIALFVSAMRHFAQALRADGYRLQYHRQADASLAELLSKDLSELAPQRVHLTRPGDWQVLQDLRAVIEATGLDWTLAEDAHFYESLDGFRQWAAGRKSLRMEYFYRALRRQENILLDESGQPEGGRWNFDSQNREALTQEALAQLTPPRRFAPDEITQAAMEWVAEAFADHPGELAFFDWPVNREQALAALEDFIDHRLPLFGRFQDAIHTGEVWLFHSRLSAALNLHLLNPREVVAAALAAWRSGKAPIAAVEGFVRQILGWREFVRGLYWLRMPGWLEENALDAQEPLPAFYWTGETDMACMADALASTLRHGYAHHIQRLMVTGLYALLLGVEPAQVHAWYHAIYVDAVEWVELPNTLGMSQFADGGVLASKPYIASGAYIQRMSNACQHCRYSPSQKQGEKACPFTVLYWNFLDRHEGRLRQSQPRLKMQYRNLDRLSAEQRQELAVRAQDIRRACRPSPT